MNKILPLTIAGLSLGAGIAYLISGDIKQGIYWISAMSLTLAVTL
jgi:hypothetical protein